MTLPLFYPLFLPTLGPLEVVILLVIILILFGPGKLPQVFGELGKGVRQFKEASKDVTEQVNKELQGDSGKPDNNESSNS